MNKGFSNLIQRLETLQSPSIKNFPWQEIADNVKIGSQTEPNLFSDFVDAYVKMLQRIRPDINDVKERALENISGFVFMADYNYDEAIVNRFTTSLKTSSNYFKNPEKYGPAMKLFAEYVGLSGPELDEYVLNPPKELN
jgi:hypothetical protein